MKSEKNLKPHEAGKFPLPTRYEWTNKYPRTQIKHWIWILFSFKWYIYVRDFMASHDKLRYRPPLPLFTESFLMNNSYFFYSVRYVSDWSPVTAWLIDEADPLIPIRVLEAFPEGERRLFRNILGKSRWIFVTFNIQSGGTESHPNTHTHRSWLVWPRRHGTWLEMP